MAQTYLSTCRAADNLVDGIDEENWQRAEKARFLMGIVTSAAAPTNTLIGNPAALKRAFDTSGKSLVRGIGHWLSDVRRPAQRRDALTSKPGVLKVGEDLAITQARS